MSAGFKVTIQQTGENYACRAAESLLQGMTRLGRGGIPVGCQNGGCGVCKVEIVAGAYEHGRMSRAHVSEEEEAHGVALACQVYPKSDLTLKVVGKMQKSVLGGFASATYR